MTIIRHRTAMPETAPMEKPKMTMRATPPVFAALLILLAAGPAAAGEKTLQDAQLDAGGRTFMRYCALCHGIDGIGSGPLAESLAAAPPDLTMLAERNGGTFPEDRVKNVIENGGPKGHGMMAMLAWGKVFNEDLGSDSHKVIDDLTAYIKSLQGR
jgi:mono/diheme cytochrome c family protein